MSNTEQAFASPRAIIEFLAEKFPACFSVKGEAKPLKVGIFEELAAAVADVEGLSKTKLRQAVRHYTSSIRYLQSVKNGAKRIDLQGVEGEAIEAEHQQHAEEKLKEIHARLAERKKQQGRARSAKAEGKDKSARKTVRRAQNVPPRKKRTNTNTKPEQNLANLKPVKLSELKVGAQVQVSLGRAPMPATVKEINRDSVLVELNSGMTVAVQAEHVKTQ